MLKPPWSTCGTLGVINSSENAGESEREIYKRRRDYHQRYLNVAEEIEEILRRSYKGEELSGEKNRRRGK